jgi:hypothetical protein
MAYIFDIDSTLADPSHRLHHIQKDPKDWEAFYEAANKDGMIHPTVGIYQLLNNADRTFLVTGRAERHRKLTEDWLDARYIYCDGLYMRKDGDHREDAVVKREIYETQIKDNYNVEAVFEDRNQCVKMWRDLGLVCYQVCDGDY